MNTKRISWLEWANVLAMFAVVLFHIPSVLELPIRSVEYIAVNVPFFLLSGISFRIYMDHRKDNITFIKFVKSRLIRFGTPTILFFSFFYVLWLLVGRNLASDTEAWYVPLLELTKGNLVTVLATYWFIFCLVTIQFIYFIIYKITKHRLLTLGICVLLHLLTVMFDIPNYYELNNAMVFIPFFSFGTCFSVSGDYERRALFVPVAYLLIFAVMFTIGNNDVFIGYNQGYIAGICLTLLFFSASCIFSALWKCPRFISFLRAGALVLLATQNNIIGVCKVVLDKITGSHDYLSNHLYCKPIVFLIVYVISIPLIYIFMTEKCRRLHCTS